MKLGTKRGQRGFSLVEALVSAVILTVGLCALLGVFTLALAANQTSQQDLIAKQMAQEAMEALLTARETANIQWQQIQNVGTGQIPDGIFVVGMQPINQAGVDGIIGTADDAVAPPQTMTLPGPDGIVGTADDIVAPLTSYQRQISITPAVVAGVAATDLRTVTITVQYNVPQMGRNKTYVLSEFISRYR
jgi:type II secretory pathway pseudopilin PulG